VRLYALDTILLLILHRSVRESGFQCIRCLAGELPCGNLVLEHEIELRVREALCLGKTEVSPKDEQQRNTSPEETALGTPVPVVLANHLGHDCVCNEDDGVVGSAREGDGLYTEARRRDFGSEGIADGSEGKLIELASICIMTR
jgi:hypothetical protein